MATLELHVKAGPAAGLTFPLEGRRSVTIGRAPVNALVLRDEKVSSHHARVDVTAGGLILTDLGSKNGTWVEGEQVNGSRLLLPGVEVHLGGSTIEVRYPVPITENGETSGVVRIAAGASPITPRPPGPRTAALGQRTLPVGMVAGTMTGALATAPRGAAESGRDVVLQPATHLSQRNLTKAQRNLAVLAEVGDLLASERDADRFLGRLMDLVFDVLPADRGCLLLVEDGGRPVPRVTRVSSETHADEILVSRSILSKVLDGASILTADAGADDRLTGGASALLQNVRAVMCVPIRGRRQSIGAIYVDTVLSTGVFSKDDLEMLSTVGVLTGTALENIQLFQQNVQHERMAAIGKVVSGLGHDIRNVLTALRGGMYLLDESLRDEADEDLRTAWQVVRHGHESIMNLVQDMVSYSKPRDPDWSLADINQVVRNAITFTREKANEKGLRVHELLDTTIAPFWFDAASIERCVLNLVSNAVDAVGRESGRVSVMTRVDDERNVVTVTVQDDGEGIPAEHRDKVFDLLFSTKGSRGTGFGLAITKKLIVEHGGRVWFQSEAGKGTTFHLELPQRAQKPAAVLV